MQSHQPARQSTPGVVLNSRSLACRSAALPPSMHFNRPRTVMRGVTPLPQHHITWQPMGSSYEIMTPALTIAMFVTQTSCRNDCWGAAGVLLKTCHSALLVTALSC